MFSLESFIGWLVTIAAGVLLSVIQELAKKYPPLGKLNQKAVAIGLAVLAGVIAYIFEFVLGVDLFTDVTGVFDIVQLVAAVFAFGQATYALRR